jgi:hypothetical protein
LDIADLTPYFNYNAITLCCLLAERPESREGRKVRRWEEKKTGRWEEAKNKIKSVSRKDAKSAKGGELGR